MIGRVVTLTLLMLSLFSTGANNSVAAGNDYNIPCDQADRWVARESDLVKQSASNPNNWYMSNRVWYGMSDSVKSFEVAHLHKYSECHSKNGDAVAITVQTESKTVAKTDYTGRIFILSVVP